MHPGLRVGISLLLVLDILSFSSCKENEPGYNQILNPLWEYDFQVGYTSSIQPEIWENLVMYSSSIEASEDLSSNDKLVALDKEEGNLVWEWSDHFEPIYQGFSVKSLKPIYSGAIAITIGGRNFCINLTNGVTIWKNRNATTTSSSSLTHIGNRLFRTDVGDLATDGRYVERIMEADFLTGNWSEVLELSGGDTLRQGVQVPSVFTSDNGDTILVFTNSTYNPQERVSHPRLLSYNLTTRSFIYDVSLGNPESGNVVDGYPVIDQSRGVVYLAVNDVMKCRNLYTGEPVWERQLNSSLLFSGFLVVGGRIFANSEGLDPTLWSINAETGKVIWSKPSAGTSSLLQYFNETIYFVGGSDGILHIVDALGGETLALIKAPSQFKDQNDYFSNNCKIDPQTGRLYVNSQRTAYCYPSYR